MLWPAGLALGAWSLVIARDDPAFSFAGASIAGAVALLGAGWALLACGLTFWGRDRETPSALCSVGRPAPPGFSPSGTTPVWGQPSSSQSGSPSRNLPAARRWAMLAYPSGRLASWGERATVVVAIVGAVVALGFLPALFFDPASQGCAQCPDNLLLAADNPDASEKLYRAGVYAGLAWSLLLIAASGWRLARSTGPRRRIVAPVVLVGSAYLGLVAAGFAASLDRGFLGSGELERGLWLAQAGALAALTLAVAWGWVRARRTRASLTRLVIDLGKSASEGGLRDVLAGTLGDPRLLVGYPVGDGRLVDAHGRPVEAAADQSTTPIVSDGRVVAMIAHRAGCSIDPELAGEVAAAARLVLENERLQAEVRAQLEDLRASRARIVEAGDAERRRLERDLHDGARQRLVGLSLSLRLLRSRLSADTDRTLIARIDRADAELRTAMADLRRSRTVCFRRSLPTKGSLLRSKLSRRRRASRFASGSCPRADSPPRWKALPMRSSRNGARSRGPARRARRPHQRRPADRGGHPDRVADLTGLEDRIGALDGRLAVDRTAEGRVRICAEILGS